MLKLIWGCNCISACFAGYGSFSACCFISFAVERFTGWGAPVAAGLTLKSILEALHGWGNQHQQALGQSQLQPLCTLVAPLTTA